MPGQVCYEKSLVELVSDVWKTGPNGTLAIRHTHPLQPTKHIFVTQTATCLALLSLKHTHTYKRLQTLPTLRFSVERYPNLSPTPNA